MIAVPWTGTVMGCGVTKSDQFHKHSRKGNQTDTLLITFSDWYKYSPISLNRNTSWFSCCLVFMFALHYNCHLFYMFLYKCIHTSVFLSALPHAAVTSKSHLFSLVCCVVVVAIVCQMLNLSSNQKHLDQANKRKKQMFSLSRQSWHIDDILLRLNRSKHGDKRKKIAPHTERTVSLVQFKV